MILFEKCGIISFCRRKNEVLGMRSERLDPYVKNKTDTDENPKCNLLEIQ